MQPRVIRGTITRRADGLWWLSLTAEIPQQVRTTPTRRQRRNGAVGVDLGVRHTATLSTRPGRVHNPRYLECALEELRRSQKHLARCQPDSARYAKAKARAGLIHADVARLRDQYLHRLSTRLASRFEAVGVEGYDVKAMLQHGSKDLPRWLRKQRNRALADSGLGTLREQLRYKTERHGSRLTVTESTAPTGRTCSACGQPRTKAVHPWHELFVCDNPTCGHIRPRRLNTARVLARMAAGEEPGTPHGRSDPPRGGEVRPEGPRPGRRSPMKRVARTRPRGRGETGTSGP